MQTGFGEQFKKHALEGVSRTGRRGVLKWESDSQVFRDRLDYGLNLPGGWLADNLAFGDEDWLDQWVGKAAKARYERSDQFRIKLRAAATFEFLNGLLRGARFLVGALGSDRVIGVGDGNDARTERDLVAGESLRVA